VIPALWTPQPGWNLETADGFDGTQLEEANWWKWSGYPGGYDQAYWDAAHVVVGGSTLQLKSTGPVTLPNGKQGYLAGGIGWPCDIHRMAELKDAEIAKLRDEVERLREQIAMDDFAKNTTPGGTWIEGGEDGK
jgi:hypothetical protein